MLPEKYLRKVRWVVLISSFLFLILFVGRLDLKEITVPEFDVSLFFVSVFVSVFFRYFISFIWFSSVNLISDEKISFSDGCVVYAYSWMARYIPGGVAAHVSRVALAREKKVRFSSSIGASILEIIFQVLSISLLLIFVDFFYAGGSGWVEKTSFILSMAVLGGVFVLAILLINLESKNAVFNSLKDFLTTAGGYRYVLSGVGNYLFAMALACLGFSLFCFSVGVDGSYFIDLVRVNLMVSLLSMIVFFIPAGVGVREVGLVSMLAPILGSELSFIIAVLSRLWTVLCDVVFFILVVMKRLI